MFLEREKSNRMKLLDSVSRIAINTMSDAAGLLAVGTGVMCAPYSTEAALVGYGRASLCFFTRFVTECGRENVSVPVSDGFKRFASNRGASLISSGVISGIGTVFSAAAIDVGNPETIMQTGAMAAFSIAGTANGVSLSLPGNHAYRQKSSGLGVVMSNAGLMMAVGYDTTAIEKLPYVLSTVVGLKLIGEDRPAHGVFQPEKIMASGTLIASFNAFSVGDVYSGSANLLYTMGMLALDAQKLCGGVAEFGQSVSRAVKLKMG